MRIAGSERIEHLQAHEQAHRSKDEERELAHVRAREACGRSPVSSILRAPGLETESSATGVDHVSDDDRNRGPSR